MIANPADKWFTRVCSECFDIESSEIPLEPLEIPQNQLKTLDFHKSEASKPRLPADAFRDSQSIDRIESIGIAGPTMNPVSPANPVRPSSAFARAST